MCTDPQIYTLKCVTGTLHFYIAATVCRDSLSSRGLYSTVHLEFTLEFKYTGDNK